MINHSQIMENNSIIQSDRLILRPFSINDVEDVFLYASDDRVTKYLTWESHVDLLQTEKVIKEFYMNNIGVYAIELRPEQKCIGCIEFRLNVQHDKGSFGCVLNSDYWNKGYMSEVLPLIFNLGFTELALNRIESTHYIGNEASGRVMEKCGMKYEGTGLQELKIKGIFYDVIHYAILKKEWKDLKCKK